MTGMDKSRTIWKHFLGFSLMVCLVGVVSIRMFGGGTGIEEFLVQWVFFTLLSGAVLLAAGRLAHHPNPNLFTTLMLGSVMLRITMCLLFLFVYTRITEPSDNSFLMWFFLLYLVFTVHEIRTLSRMVTGPRS